MDVRRILQVFNEFDVACLLIGGMNFFLRHDGPVTRDVDLWIDDTGENRARCERALTALDAEWGRTDADWGKVAERAAGWLAQQGVYCCHTAAGSVDIFRTLKGPPVWHEARRRAVKIEAWGQPVYALNDEDMLACQLALPAEVRHTDRVERLRRTVEGSGHE